MTEKAKLISKFAALFIVLFIVFLIDLSIGSTNINFYDVLSILSGNIDSIDEGMLRIIVDIRLSRIVVALLVGIALPISALQMQTFFQNPLAGPYVLGVSSGASLGVALFILGMPFLSSIGLGFIANIGMLTSAWLFSALIIFTIALVSIRLKDIMMILIMGIMFSSAISSIVQILQYFSEESALKSFVLWTMGSLSNLDWSQILIICISVFFGLLLSIFLIKALNLLLLGENYALSMGLNMTTARNLIFLSTILLSASITAFTGPIAFIGLAVPHIARIFFSTADHRVLIPAVALIGMIIILISDAISTAMTLPINTITSLIGIPVVIAIVLRNRNTF